MPTELRVAALGAVLLLIHIFAAISQKTRQYGTAWNMGPRDETRPPLEALAGRLARAQANFQETFPIALVALIGVVVARRTSEATALGGWMWLLARVVYLPVYAKGIPRVRTGLFLISLVGLGLVIWPLIFG